MPMKRLLLATLFAALLMAAVDGPRSVREVAPGVWVRTGDRDRNQPANTGWVIFKDYVLVIDANFPWGAKEILPEIRKTTNKPVRYVFNTHYHGDHAYGSSLFTDEGAAVVCSQPCAEETRTKGRSAWDRNQETGAYSLKPYRLIQPSIVFGESMAFDDGEHRVELKLVGPGHSRGDAIAYLPKEGILFTGDLCVTWPFGNNMADADADHGNWLKALDTMAKLNVKTLVPGHGPLGEKGGIATQRAYLADTVDRVRAGIAAGKSAEQLAREIDLTKHKIGQDRERNAISVRAVHAKLSAR